MINDDEREETGRRRRIWGGSMGREIGGGGEKVAGMFIRPHRRAFSLLQAFASKIPDVASFEGFRAETILALCSSEA